MRTFIFRQLLLVLACFAVGELGAQQFLSSTRIVTLALPATNLFAVGTPFPTSPLLDYPVSTNDIVEIKAITSYPPTATPALVSLHHSSGTTASLTNAGTIYTGLTGITLKQGETAYLSGGTNFHPFASLLVTIAVTSPSNPSALPANSVVIPTDSSGPVNIILESSADLVNWNAALPGTYGTTATNRFFRVRAERSP